MYPVDSSLIVNPLKRRENIWKIAAETLRDIERRVVIIYSSYFCNITPGSSKTCNNASSLRLDLKCMNNCNLVFKSRLKKVLHGALANCFARLSLRFVWKKIAMEPTALTVTDSWSSKILYHETILYCEKTFIIRESFNQNIFFKDSLSSKNLAHSPENQDFSLQ